MTSLADLPALAPLSADMAGEGQLLIGFAALRSAMNRTLPARQLPRGSR